MAVQGIKPPSFEPKTHEMGALSSVWREFKSELNIYFLASGQQDIPDNRKIALMLYQMGRQYQKVFENELKSTLTLANQKVFESVLVSFDGYFEPKKITTSYISSFQSRKQSQNESINDFISSLREIALHCDFGTKEEDFLCVQIANGVKDESLRKKLWGESLTLAQVVQKCQLHEMREQQFPSLSSTSNVHAIRRSGRSRFKRRDNASSRGYATQHHSFARGQALPPTHNQTSFRGQSYRGQQHKSFPSRGQGQRRGKSCRNCGSQHSFGQCPAYGKTCNSCGRTGHFSRACRTVHTVSISDPIPHIVSATEPNLSQFSDQFSDTLHIYALNNDNSLNNNNNSLNNPNEWSVILRTPYEAGKGAVKMFIDTQAQCNVISMKTFQNMSKHANLQLEPTLSTITAFGNNSILPVGTTKFNVIHNNVFYTLTCEVVDGNVPNLLGSNDSMKLGLVKRVHSCEQDTKRSDKNTSEFLNRIPNVSNIPQPILDILLEYPDRFPEDTVGKIPGECHLSIDPEYSDGPVSYPCRPLPAAMKELTKKQLEYLENNDIIKKVPPNVPTPWCSQLHVVHKKDKKSVRVCIDPKFLNKALLREVHPIKTIEDVLTMVEGSKCFTTLDANMGFFQIQLDYDSQLLTAFSTPWGRYMYKRLPMGICSAPEIYQRKIEEVFEGIENFASIFDDILLHNKDIKTHCPTLRATLQRAREQNLTFRLSKCIFAQPEVPYTGFILTGEGVKVQPQKVKAILEMPQPTNIDEVRTFLGMATYLSKHIPNFSDLTKDLRDLIKEKNESFLFAKPQIVSFNNIKKALVSSPVLGYYSAKDPIVISCDASKHGLGASIWQKGKPVAYGSKSLTTTEQAYAQIEKELLAVVFATRKFHNLIYGRNDIEIETDHLPLISIIKKPLGQVPMRLQKMLLKLQPYSFKLVSKSGKEIPVADALSRLPLKDSNCPDLGEDFQNFHVCITEITAINAFSGPKLEYLRESTNNDIELQKLITQVIDGWPTLKQHVPYELRPYWDYRDEISVYDGIVFKGERIIIPKSMQNEILHLVHYSHQGMVKSKQLARDVVYWKGLNKQIEDIVSKCSTCQTYRAQQQKEPMLSTKVPKLPWEIVSSDLFEFEDEDYIVIADHFSGYLDVEKLDSLSTSSVITKLKNVFSTHGIPQLLYHDPGTQYTSLEFKEFGDKWGFKTISYSATYSQANGMAEKHVQIAKNIIKKAKKDGHDLQLALLDYRNTPRDPILGSPVQRCMGRRTRTRLPTSNALLIPSNTNNQTISRRLQYLRDKSKFYYDKHSRSLPQLSAHDNIRYRTGKTWTPAKIISEGDNPRSFNIQTPGDRIIVRNRRHLLKTKENMFDNARNEHAMRHVAGDSCYTQLPIPTPQLPPTPKLHTPASQLPQNVQNNNTVVPMNNSANVNTPVPIITTRSGRISKKPAFLKDFVTK